MSSTSGFTNGKTEQKTPTQQIHQEYGLNLQVGQLYDVFFFANWNGWFTYSEDDGSIDSMAENDS